jgi:acetyl esterase
MTSRTQILIKNACGGDLPLHIYRPRNGDAPPRCALLFLRGSGMCMGDMELYDPVIQQLCVMSEALIMAPDYRLAPEHCYPAGHDDAWTAFLWLKDNAAALGTDPSKLVVFGDSAGGMLAAATALRARSEFPEAIALQILVAPALGISESSGSARRYANGYLLDVPDLDWLYKTYLGSKSGKDDPVVYPIYETDLSGTPPTLMITAGADIMRDDAEDFLRRVHSLGVRAELMRYESTIHPFLNMGKIIPACDDALSHIASVLIRSFD